MNSSNDIRLENKRCAMGKLPIGGRFGESRFESVPPTFVRNELLGRPQVEPRRPQIRPVRRSDSVSWWIRTFVLVCFCGTVAAILLCMALVRILEFAQMHDGSAMLPTPIPIATPVPVQEAPRAELIRMPAVRAQLLALPNWRVGREQMLRMPDGLQVWARLKGSVFSTSQLPMTGNHIGDTWLAGDGSEWVWLTAPGSNQATWIDP